MVGWLDLVSQVRPDGIHGRKEMTTKSETGFIPSCMPKQVGTCARCDLAYDCQTKMSGRLMPWPVMALAVAVALTGVLALIL